MLRLTLIALLIVLVALALFKSSAQTSTTFLRLTSTSEQSLNLNPILSEDGSVVVFESTSDLAGAGSGTGFHMLRFNTHNFSGFEEIAPSRANAVSLSTNGQKIAFASTEDLVGENADRNSEIYFFDGRLKQLTHTLPRTELTRLTDGNFEPSLSGDGHLVAFSSNRAENTSDTLEILFADTTSNETIQLTTSPSGTRTSNPKLTADGSRVYFIQEKPGDARPDLMLGDISNRSTRVLVNDISELSLTTGRSLSSDGNRIVYSASTGSNQTQVFLFDTRSDATQQLTHLGSRTTDVPLNASISGDGRRVTFATRRLVVNPSDGGVELYLLDLPTGKIDQITSAPSSATAEVLSSLNHDGSAVVLNFPRIISGPVSDPDLSNNSEIYSTTLPQRPEFGEAMVANAATRDFSQHRIASDSMAIISGSHLCNIEQEAKLLDGKLPFAIGGTTVKIGGNLCRLLYASPTEVIFVVPADLPDGPAEFVVTNSEAFPSKAEAVIARSALGIFTDGAKAVVLNSDTFLSDPFDPTDGHLRLTLFATGVRHSSQLSVTVNGEVATVEAVAASSFPGLDEIHVRLPSELRGAGAVSIAIKADEVEAHLVSTTLSGSFMRDVMINEVLADPPDGIAGDANHDGTRDSAADEFVELVNSTARDLDLSGYQLQTRAANAATDTLRHRFTAGTLLPAGTAIVVFGGGAINSTNTSFGGAQIVRASSGGLSLSNSGGVVTLRDASGAVVSSASYGSSVEIPGDANQSITRAPDVNGSFVLHQAASESQTRAFSPGVRVDGSPFLAEPAVALIQVSPGTGQIPTGASLQFSAHAFDQQGHELSDVIFRWNSSNPVTLTIDLSGTARGLSSGLAEVTAQARGVQSAPAVINVVAPTPTPSVSPSPSASPSPSPSPITVPSVVISEFRTRGPNGANDEFVEIYNNSNAPVDVSGWKLKASSSNGSISNRAMVPSGTTIPVHGHFLFANSAGYSGSVLADQTFSSGFANDGGIALTLPNDLIVDQLGLSSGSGFREGMHLSPLATDANQSYERRPGGPNGSTQDTADNFNDFQITSPSDPQNLASNPTPNPSPTPSPRPTPSPSPTANPTPTATPTPTPTPTPVLTALVISEFRTRGPAGASDEFIEIYNNSDSPVNVSGLKLRSSSNTGTITTRLTINSNTFIPGRGHFLAVNSAGYSGSVSGDQSFTSGIANDGGIALTATDDTIIDQVGLSAGSAFKEGNQLAPLPTDSNQSYERKPGGVLGSTIDTQDNSNDFQLLVPGEPQNTMSPPTPGVTPSPTPTPLPSPTVTPTPLPTPSPSPSPSPSPIAMPQIVISQIFGGGGNSGAPFRNDFIELFNAGNTPQSLSGWSIQYASATATTWSVTSLPTVLLAPGQYFLIQEASGGSNGASLPSPDASGTIALAATAGKVALLRSTVALSGACPNDPNIADLVGYGNSASCFEGVPGLAPSNTTAIVRSDSGCTDSANNANDFSASAPNPRNTSTALHLCSFSSLVFPKFEWFFVEAVLVITACRGGPL
jgi:uncharacterized protein (TIGR03437 family)